MTSARRSSNPACQRMPRPAASARPMHWRGGSGYWAFEGAIEIPIKPVLDTLSNIRQDEQSWTNTCARRTPPHHARTWPRGRHSCPPNGLSLKLEGDSAPPPCALLPRLPSAGDSRKPSV